MIPHNKPTLGIEEEQAALRVIRSGWVAQGDEVEAFENEFCEFIGLPVGYAVAVASGTSALFMALWALQAQGKRVAFPVYTCSSLRHAVAMIGAIEQLVDVSPGTPNIDLQALSQTRADIAIVPHMFGLPLCVSNLKNIEIIEDCAQALGASVNGTFVGLQGKLGIFSFYATKLITSGGQGGMVVSKDKALIDAIKDYRQFDCRQDKNKRFNFQMTDLQAAIGRAQLRKLPIFLSRRVEIFKRYIQAGLKLLDITSESNIQLSPVRYRAILKTNASSNRNIIELLASMNIKVIVPIEHWELLEEYNLFPNALKLSQESISLPIYPLLTDKQLEYVVSKINFLS
ncbi:DegT/DnrJ/EryC1/StrS aminotransferase family protein [Nostoc sp. TCL240-02]|uniref:DegT/DnrJ/EryC1/StrS family aminotransferase n=1 Tax=Nostoc sp. TCL240-02 TaxID=2572090 RepID=UPI00157F8B9A|nr:DegT/DnrJ/EryC1/StrS family aminotransferase [Nostoc sp. TCL240-02]